MHKVVYTGTHSQIGVAKELVDLVVRKGAAALTQLDNERHLMDNMFHDHVRHNRSMSITFPNHFRLFVLM